MDAVINKLYMAEEESNELSHRSQALQDGVGNMTSFPDTPQTSQMNGSPLEQLEMELTQKEQQVEFAFSIIRSLMFIYIYILACLTVHCQPSFPDRTIDL